MAENINYTFDFGVLKGFTPHEGEGADVIPFDGGVMAKIASFSTYLSKDKKNPMAKFSLVIEDQDAKGMRLIADIHCGGTDSKGESMARQLGEVLVKTGTKLENIHQNAASGAKMDINALCQQLVGRTAYLEIEADTYEGRPNTKVRNWKSEEWYNQAKAVGAHRRPRRQVTASTAASQAAAAGFNLGGTNGVQPTGTGASTLPSL